MKIKFDFGAKTLSSSFFFEMPQHGRIRRACCNDSAASLVILSTPRIALSRLRGSGGSLPAF
jgi:hypothetical protein